MFNSVFETKRLIILVILFFIVYFYHHIPNSCVCNVNCVLDDIDFVDFYRIAAINRQNFLSLSQPCLASYGFKRNAREQTNWKSIGIRCGCVRSAG